MDLDQLIERASTNDIISDKYGLLIMILDRDSEKPHAIFKTGATKIIFNFTTNNENSIISPPSSPRGSLKIPNSMDSNSVTPSSSTPNSPLSSYSNNGFQRLTKFKKRLCYLELKYNIIKKMEFKEIAKIYGYQYADFAENWFTFGIEYLHNYIKELEESVSKKKNNSISKKNSNSSNNSISKKIPIVQTIPIIQKKMKIKKNNPTTILDYLNLLII